MSMSEFVNLTFGHEADHDKLESKSVKALEERLRELEVKDQH